MYTVDHFANKGWLNCDQVINLMCFVRTLATKLTLIAYFLGNISAKNSQNLFMFVNVVAL